MKNPILELGADIQYVSPSVTLFEFQSEGILCASNENVFEEEGNW